MKYDVSGEAQLSDDARALYEDEPLKFAQENDLAEELLELDTDPTYTDESGRVPPAMLETKIRRAVVLQVNYQVASGIEAFVQTADGPTEVRAAFRSVRGEQPATHPQARIIRDQVRAMYAELKKDSVATGLGFATTLRSMR